MKAYNDKIKNRARFLRKQGFSYGEIRQELKIAKSTIKNWVDDIKLKPAFKKRLYTEQIQRLTRGINSSHNRRHNQIKSIIKGAEKEIRLPLSWETYQLMGAALYWGEGSKTQDFSVVNSDPYLIRFMVGWMKNVLHLNPSNLKAHLNIYPQQNENKIKKFWSKITGIPIKNFGKSFIKPQNKNYRKNNLYYGTIKIRARQGSDIRHRVSGWISSALRDEKIQINIKINWNKHKLDKRL